ncbi:MAG: hypothetical protein IJS34_00640 [Alphaproteobacteria bacterium]|nr:hypothetical protein [Alphaproteobacteria bacterium]
MQKITIRLLILLCCSLVISLPAWSALPNGCSNFTETNDGQKVQGRDAKRMGIKKLLWQYPCENNKDKGICVEWGDLNFLSHGQAIAAAKSYAKRRNNVDVICSRGYFTCGTFSKDPHIVCAAKDPKYNKDFYEFIVNEISETSDSKWRKSVGLAQCRTFLVDKNANFDKIEVYKYFAPPPEAKELPYSKAMTCSFYDDNLSYDENKIREEDNCMAMDESLRDNFGFEILRRYESKRGFAPVICTINFGNIGSFDEQKKCKNMMTNHTNVDNNRFSTLKGTLNEEMKAWLAGYVQRELDEPLKTFSCKDAFSPCNTGLIKNQTDDILDCTANGKLIRFRFDSLSTGLKQQKKRTSSAMQCMNTQTGEFDGRRCRGITKSQCVGPKGNCDEGSLCATVPGGTRWDSSLQACVLKAANMQANTDKAIDITLTVGIPAALVTAELVSSGSATVIIFAGVGTAAGITSEIMTATQQTAVQKYLTKLESCVSPECVKEFLEEYLSTLSSYEYNLSDDVIKSLDSILSKKIKILTAGEQARFQREIEAARKKDTYFDTFFKNERAEWTTQDTQKVINIVGFVSSFIPLSTKAINAASKFTKMPKTARALRSAYKSFEKVGNVVDRTNSTMSVLNVN